jgi:excinuclease UvrABC helicase subunit UvrB
VIALATVVEAVMVVAPQVVVEPAKEAVERIVSQIAVGIARLGALDVVALVKEVAKEVAQTLVVPLAKIVVLEDDAKWLKQ